MPGFVVLHCVCYLSVIKLYNMEQQQFNQFNPRVDLPNATTVLVLGILSIIFMGIIGAILATIALSMASTARHMYQSNPDAYTASSYSKMNSGRICAIVSLCILGFIILIAAVVIMANL
jgi:hypothetical protein